MAWIGLLVSVRENGGEPHQLLPNIAAKHRLDSSDLFAAALEQSLTVLTEQIGDARA